MLNSISSLGQLHIPRVEEILTKLKLRLDILAFDFTGGSFHQKTVHKDTVPLTALATPRDRGLPRRRRKIRRKPETARGEHARFFHKNCVSST